MPQKKEKTTKKKSVEEERVPKHVSIRLSYRDYLKLVEIGDVAAKMKESKDAKKAVKIRILDRGESWGDSTQNNKTRLQLHGILPTCSFYIRIAQKRDLFGVTSYTPHDCPLSTHTQFKPRHSA